MIKVEPPLPEEELKKRDILAQLHALSDLLTEQNVPNEGRWMILPAWMTRTKGKRTVRKWKKRLMKKKSPLGYRPLKKIRDAGFTADVFSSRDGWLTGGGA